MKIKLLFILCLALLLVACNQEKIVDEPIVVDQPSVEETPVEEDPIEGPVDEPVEETIEEPEEPVENLVGGAVETNTGAIHTVIINETKFVPAKLTIQKGDTVVWDVQRTKTSALLMGVRNCAEIRSETMTEGDSFSYTFEEEEECTFVDAIIVSATMKVMVE